MKVTVIPIVIGALGIVTKELLQGLEDLEIRDRVETIHLSVCPTSCLCLSGSPSLSLSLYIYIYIISILKGIKISFCLGVFNFNWLHSKISLLIVLWQLSCLDVCKRNVKIEVYLFIDSNIELSSWRGRKYVHYIPCKGVGPPSPRKKKSLDYDTKLYLTERFQLWWFGEVWSTPSLLLLLDPLWSFSYLLGSNLWVKLISLKIIPIQ